MLSMLRKFQEGYNQVFRVQEDCLVVFLPMATKSPFLCYGNSNSLSSLITENCSYHLFDDTEQFTSTMQQLEYKQPACPLRIIATAQALKNLEELTDNFESPRLKKLLDTTQINLETEDANNVTRYKFNFYNDDTFAIFEGSQKVRQFTDAIWSKKYTEEIQTQQLANCLAFIRVFGTNKPLIQKKTSKFKHIVQNIETVIEKLKPEEFKPQAGYKFWLDSPDRGRKPQQLDFASPVCFEFQNIFSPVFYIETQEILDGYPSMQLSLKDNDNNLGSLDLQLYSSKLLSNQNRAYQFHIVNAEENLISHLERYQHMFLLNQCLLDLESAF